MADEYFTPTSASWFGQDVLWVASTAERSVQETLPIQQPSVL